MLGFDWERNEGDTDDEDELEEVYLRFWRSIVEAEGAMGAEGAGDMGVVGAH